MGTIENAPKKTNKSYNKQHNNKKTYNKSFHRYDIMSIIMTNYGIKKHTIINLLAALKAAGKISDTHNCYVKFNKETYTVSEKNGGETEYSIKDAMFIKALSKAHSDLAADSQNIIIDFMNDNNISIE